MLSKKQFMNNYLQRLMIAIVVNYLRKLTTTQNSKKLRTNAENPDKFITTAYFDKLKKEDIDDR